MFQAYFDCRKNKRNTINALKFEKHFEKNVFKLCEEIKSGTYQPGRNIAFIVNNPVKREIFAADFRDRVVHHWLINKLNPLFEKTFIYNSYACRVAKGTHFGIKQIYGFIKSCSKNYISDCYILKLDIQGFFMHINRNLLFERLNNFIQTNYLETDTEMVIDICNKIVFNNPSENCIIKGSKNDWKGLPKSKSLFSSPKNCGLPIGNLTSQVFANFYMNLFDQYVKKELDIKYYGRYVDDFIIIHPDKEHLKMIQFLITDFLNKKLELTLHPKKIYLQHYSKGVKFLGTVIKPNRIYIANRTKGNFYKAIEKQNKIARDHSPRGIKKSNSTISQPHIIQRGKPTIEEQAGFLSSMNSYLGIMQHYKTYKMRKRMIFKNLSAWWWNYVYLTGGISRFEKKRKISLGNNYKKNQIK